MDVAKRIKEVRTAKRYKQIEIANALNLDKGNYFRLETRGNKLTFEQVEQIAKAMDISLKDLLFDEKDNDCEKQLADYLKEIELLKREKELLNEKLEFENKKTLMLFNAITEIIDKHSKSKANEIVDDLFTLITVFTLSNLVADRANQILSERKATNQELVTNPL